ncbi:hypothetical protein UFOVP2_49 [uncultured Caudovirales phage]|uniref:Right handed beta helix domain-containing protein n=1 Tax=uncultured Caudovirales phage TaxID=2100421 RepID=A0A6J5KKF3_9CAUD|nr:hypothetical protein UFOVP2_49 [uncultured Caudovirales phage]
MASTLFSSGVQIASSWLNQVNNFVFNKTFPDSTTAATTQDLASTASGKGAAQVGYLPAGSSASSTRTVQSVLRETVSITDYGAVADSSTNCGPALQAAHDALPANGGIIIVPQAATYYLFTTGVSFTKPIVIQGPGWFSANFYTTTNAIVLITTIAKLDIKDLAFLMYGAARTTGTAVLQATASSSHGHSTYINCLFDGGNSCYHTQNSNSFVFIGCGVYPAGQYGLFVENIAVPDTGDWFVDDCTFSGATVANIYIPTSSGVYIANNKFNGGVGHVLISYGTDLVGNNLFLSNSFEGHTSFAVKILGTSGVSTKNVFTGNHFSSGTAAVTMAHIILGAGAQNNVICGNSFNSTIAGDTLHTGISILTGSANTTITGNSFHQIYNGIVGTLAATLGITMSGNRFSADVAIPYVGDDGSTFGASASSKEITVSRYMSESAGTLTGAFNFKGTGTLEIMVYGIAQGVGKFNYSRKVALFSDTTTADINAAVVQGSAILFALAVSGGATQVQIAKSAGTSFTGYVEVIARGQITSVVRV